MLGLIVLGYILKSILLIILAVLLLVLFIPFKYGFSGGKYENGWFRASVTWLYGGVRINAGYNEGRLSSGVRILGFHKKLQAGERRPADDNEEKSENQKKKPKKERKRKSPYGYLTREVIKKGLYCILKILNHCKPESFELSLKGGFGDPLYAGLLCALQGQGFAILNRYNIDLQPDFEDDATTGSLTMAGSIRLYYLLGAALEFVLTRPVRSIWLKNLKIIIKRRIKTWRTLILKKA
ncbi:hypothetical protein CLHUN_07690 [Ruminiclostridium hungatei]|uniref:DUF2953 domain-containing protein n=1 Tax=Ruminiclostridium hungatei TaxID=48256 RepID=A0A1V4SND3_RUMHU|nr:hypothetical protein [Ruminiclostridium hungatei]OPX45399.1 hypothetical protein CLHUN_07690 [Ruminiclostridium hungatei]